MIVGLQSLTLKCIAKVFSLKVSLQFRGYEGFYIVAKDIRKAHIKTAKQRVSRVTRDLVQS